MRRVLWLGLCLLGAPTIALAGSGASQWNGPYIGLHLGGAWGGDNYNVFDPTGGPSIFSGSEHERGAVLGAQAGYNVAVGSGLVLGVEADLSGTGITGETGGCTGTGCAESHSKIDSLGTLRARLGFARDNWLVYATGGAAWVDGHNNRTITSVTNNAFNNLVGQSSIVSGSNWGWTAGGGAEIKIRDNWSLGLDYLHIGYDSSAQYAYTDPSADKRSSGHDTLDIVRVGLNYHFDWGGSPESYHPMK